MGKLYRTILATGLVLLALDIKELFQCLDIKSEGKPEFQTQEKYERPASLTPIPLYFEKRDPKKVIRLPPVDMEHLEGVREGNTIRYHIEVEPNPDEKPRNNPENKGDRKTRPLYFNPEEHTELHFERQFTYSK